MSIWENVNQLDKLPPLNQVVLLQFGIGPDASFAWGGRSDCGEGWLWGLCYNSTVHMDGFDEFMVDDDYQPKYWMSLPKPADEERA